MLTTIPSQYAVESSTKRLCINIVFWNENKIMEYSITFLDLLHHVSYIVIPIRVSSPHPVLLFVFNVYSRYSMHMHTIHVYEYACFMYTFMYMYCIVVCIHIGTCLYWLDSCMHIVQICQRHFILCRQSPLTIF